MLKTIRRKTDELKAIQFDGTCLCMNYINTVFGAINTLSVTFHSNTNIVNHWKIETGDNKLGKYVEKGNYIIKGFYGCFSVIGEKEFNETYEIIKEK